MKVDLCTERLCSSKMVLRITWLVRERICRLSDDNTNGVGSIVLVDDSLIYD